MAFEVHLSWTAALGSVRPLIGLYVAIYLLSNSIFSAVGCGFLFFLSPLLGQASDVYGRKV